MVETETPNLEQDTGVRKPLMWLTFAVAGVVFVLDQITKLLAVAKLEPGQPVEVIGRLLQFNLVRNSGAAFSLGSGMTVIFTLVAVGVVFVVVRYSRKIRSVWWAIALGGLLGGAIGNVVDRMLRSPGPFRGHVIDFLELPHWPVFNVADMCISGSAVLMVILVLRGISLDGTRQTKKASSD